MTDENGTVQHWPLMTADEVVSWLGISLDDVVQAVESGKLTLRLGHKGANQFHIDETRAWELQKVRELGDFLHNGPDSPTGVFYAGDMRHGRDLAHACGRIYYMMTCNGGLACFIPDTATGTTRFEMLPEPEGAEDQDHPEYLEDHLAYLKAIWPEMLAREGLSETYPEGRLISGGALGPLRSKVLARLEAQGLLDD